MTMEIPRLTPERADDGRQQCLWCNEMHERPCRGQYDSLTCTQRLSDPDGPTPEEWAALDANARGESAA